jgi:hypothetical protein
MANESSAVATRSSYRGTNAKYDAIWLRWLIDAFLLKKPTPFPWTKASPLAQHVLTGRVFPDALG